MHGRLSATFLLTLNLCSSNCKDSWVWPLHYEKNVDEVSLLFMQIGRDSVFWKVESKRTKSFISCSQKKASNSMEEFHFDHNVNTQTAVGCVYPVPESLQKPTYGQPIALYQAAHSRAGDKGNDLNFSIIPHFAEDIEKLKLVITPEWITEVVLKLLNPSSFPDPDSIAKRNKWAQEHVKVEIYEVKGIHSLNVVVRNILDGGVNCSRRIDRHGKCISDLILCQQVVLPPWAQLCNDTNVLVSFVPLLQESNFNPFYGPDTNAMCVNFEFLCV